MVKSNICERNYNEKTHFAPANRAKEAPPDLKQNLIVQSTNTENGTFQGKTNTCKTRQVTGRGSTDGEKVYTGIVGRA